MRHPTLVFVPVLKIPVDAALPEHESSEAIDAGIIMHVLIPGSFTAAVRRMEVDLNVFRNPPAQMTIFKVVSCLFLDEIDVSHTSVHLIRRCIHHNRRFLLSSRSL